MGWLRCILLHLLLLLAPSYVLAQPSRAPSLDTVLAVGNTTDEDITTTGTITADTFTGGNVTSGADPGHTHTGASLSGIDISDDTNLTASNGVDLTGDNLTAVPAEIDHDSLLNFTADEHFTKADFLDDSNDWLALNDFMQGLRVPDNKAVWVGTGSDFRIIHNGTQTDIINSTGLLSVTSATMTLNTTGIGDTRVNILSGVGIPDTQELLLGDTTRGVNAIFDGSGKLNLYEYPGSTGNQKLIVGFPLIIDGGGAGGYQDNGYTFSIQQPGSTVVYFEMCQSGSDSGGCSFFGEQTFGGSTVFEFWNYNIGANNGGYAFFNRSSVVFEFDSIGNTLIAGALELDGALNHDGTTVGFYGVAPVTRSTGWNATNVTTDRVFDANSTTTEELADVLGTLINYLKTRGDLGA